LKKCGGGDGFNPFGAHRVGIHRATASPVNDRWAKDGTHAGSAMNGKTSAFPPHPVRL
jgi:hypothetical protein